MKSFRCPVRVLQKITGIPDKTEPQVSSQGSGRGSPGLCLDWKMCWPFSKLHPELGTPPLPSHLHEPFQPWEDPTGQGLVPLVDKLVGIMGTVQHLWQARSELRSAVPPEVGTLPPPAPSASRGVSAGSGHRIWPAHLLHFGVSCDHSGADPAGPHQQLPVNFLFVAINPC